MSEKWDEAEIHFIEILCFNVYNEYKQFRIENSDRYYISYIRGINELEIMYVLIILSYLYIEIWYFENIQFSNWIGYLVIYDTFPKKHIFIIDRKIPFWNSISKNDLCCRNQNANHDLSIWFTKEGNSISLFLLPDQIS